jgi:penicillin-binding protein 1C
VVGVWVGNADNRPMRDVSGVSGAAPLWRDVLDALLDGTPSNGFERPPGVGQVALCSTSEALATTGCPSQRLEWLRASDVPPVRPRSETGLRIVFPDPDMVIELDPSLSPAVQQLPIEVEPAGPATVLVDGAPVGPGAVWAPTPGHHVLTARSGTLSSEPVAIEVVLSGLERLP